MVLELATLEAIVPLGRDLKEAARLLTPSQIRWLVDTYYQIQDYRIAAKNQERSQKEEPVALVGWMYANMVRWENNIKRALDAWTDQPLGQWCKSIYGIGPVITAGLMAHIDIRQAPTAGHIWRFAGLDPTSSWGKGEKQPWNARLKVLAWKAGESFVKFSNQPECFYGHLYRERKILEAERNEAGLFAEQAAAMLGKKRFGHDTTAYQCYSQGKLPPAHVHARVRRYAVKLFLSHYHYVAHLLEFGVPPSDPYPLAHQGHAHFLPVPNLEVLGIG